MTANTHAARLPVTRQALQWRLMVLWMVALLLPTLMLIIPLWRGLAAALDHNLCIAMGTPTRRHRHSRCTQ
ncbi:hypothetical protein [Candidatus Aalborgicola defluviihabitans]|uniref:hypothetical protein n=1 Tax=Candidatus Aalborgicola defluviihabitans TaxID=3386187 RepID=UPI001ECDC2D5|nr:hypothetical protein [Burkholderiales bacterium]